MENSARALSIEGPCNTRADFASDEWDHLHWNASRFVRDRTPCDAGSSQLLRDDWEHTWSDVSSSHRQRFRIFFGRSLGCVCVLDHSDSMQSSVAKLNDHLSCHDAYGMGKKIWDTAIDWTHVLAALWHSGQWAELLPATAASETDPKPSAQSVCTFTKDLKS